MIACNNIILVIYIFLNIDSYYNTIKKKCDYLLVT